MSNQRPIICDYCDEPLFMFYGVHGHDLHLCSLTLQEKRSLANLIYAFDERAFPGVVPFEGGDDSEPEIDLRLI